MRIKGGEGGKQKARDGGIKNGENKLVGCTRARRCQKKSKSCFCCGFAEEMDKGKDGDGGTGERWYLYRSGGSVWW